MARRTVDGAGNVIVSDNYKHCIVIFSSEGGVVRSIGGLGSGAGQLQYRLDITQGLENAPAAFLKLFDGSNQGKVVVQAGPEN